MARWALVIASIVVLAIAGWLLFEPVERSGGVRAGDGQEDGASPGGEGRTARSRDRARGPAPIDLRGLGPAISAQLPPGEAPPPKLDGPGQAEARESARTAFERVLDELEDVATGGRVLSGEDKKRLYRQASMAYVAVSEHADATDAAQRRYLEETRALMMLKLREAGIQPGGVAD
jgi:hypothetical protein